MNKWFKEKKIRISYKNLNNIFGWGLVAWILLIVFSAGILNINGKLFAGQFFNAGKSLTKINLDKYNFDQPTETPEPTETENVTKESVQGITTQSIIDSDPVIACQNPNCGSINIKQSLCSDNIGYVCCQVDNKWTWYSSRNQCSQDQKRTQNNQQNNPVTTTQSTQPYQPIQYPPCTINYIYSSPKTYYNMPPDWCQKEQASIDNINSHDIYSQPQPAQQTNNVESCRSNVTSKYQGLLQSCNTYGGSARDACIQTYEQQRQGEYNSCG